MRSNSNSSQKSFMSSSQERIKKIDKEVGVQWEKIDDKIEEVEEKIKQANEVHQVLRAQRSLRARSHNSMFVS